MKVERGVRERERESGNKAWQDKGYMVIAELYFDPYCGEKTSLSVMQGDFFSFIFRISGCVHSFISFWKLFSFVATSID